VEVFKVRRQRSPPTILSDSLVAALKISKDKVQELFDSMCYILEIALYENNSSLGPLFPEDFHKDLKTLILQIINAHLAVWRAAALNQQCSLSKLTNFDWRIDVKRASEMMSNMSVPTVLVQLSLEDHMKASASSNNIKTVNFELNKQTLETMLDGLKKIKDQLASLK